MKRDPIIAKFPSLFGVEILESRLGGGLN